LLPITSPVAYFLTCHIHTHIHTPTHTFPCSDLTAVKDVLRVRYNVAKTNEDTPAILKEAAAAYQEALLEVATVTALH
jgi:hypothetical protein